MDAELLKTLLIVLSAVSGGLVGISIYLIAKVIVLEKRLDIVGEFCGVLANKQLKELIDNETKKRKND